eukprot:1997075-Lingulodinium_polyedra.AAC.1
MSHHSAEAREKFREDLSRRFQLGKYVQDRGEFIGRALEFMGDKTTLSQEKYIAEELQPVALGRGRRSEP